MRALYLKGIVFLLFGLFLIDARGQELSVLKISDNQRFIVTQVNKPFFWLGGTAWELIQRCNKEEIDQYLTDRADKTFIVILTAILTAL